MQYRAIYFGIQASGIWKDRVTLRSGWEEHCRPEAVRFEPKTLHDVLYLVYHPSLSSPPMKLRAEMEEMVVYLPACFYRDKIIAPRLQNVRDKAGIVRKKNPAPSKRPRPPEPVHPSKAHRPPASHESRPAPKLACPSKPAPAARKRYVAPPLQPEKQLLLEWNGEQPMEIDEASAWDEHPLLLTCSEPLLLTWNGSEPLLNDEPLTCGGRALLAWNGRDDAYDEPVSPEEWLLTWNGVETDMEAEPVVQRASERTARRIAFVIEYLRTMPAPQWKGKATRHRYVQVATKILNRKYTPALFGKYADMAEQANFADALRTFNPTAAMKVDKGLYVAPFQALRKRRDFLDMLARI